MDRYNTQKRLDCCVKVLVTGINGFVGGHLAEKLNQEGHEVDGCGLQEEAGAGIMDDVKDYYKADLTDSADVEKLPLEKYEAVIHLAGLAAVGASFDEPS